MQASPEEKIRLFRAMFCGREDVFAERWESKAGKNGYQPACVNQWIRGVCPKCAAFGRGGAKKVPVSCAECPVRQFEPISDRVIANHLRGRETGRTCGFSSRSRRRRHMSVTCCRLS